MSTPNTNNSDTAWSGPEVSFLKTLLERKRTVETIAKRMRRTPEDVQAKITELRGTLDDLPKPSPRPQDMNDAMSALEQALTAGCAATEEISKAYVELREHLASALTQPELQKVVKEIMKAQGFKKPELMRAGIIAAVLHRTMIILPRPAVVENPIQPAGGEVMSDAG